MGERHGKFATRVILAVVVMLGLGGALVLAAGALAALPALLAFVPLLAGRYLGADKLEALIERRRSGAVPRPLRSPLPRIASHASTPRGGSLIAFALAKRPPPALAAAS